jgi:hypothetical protein
MKRCSRREYMPILQCPQGRGSLGLAENPPEGFFLFICHAILDLERITHPWKSQP